MSRVDAEFKQRIFAFMATVPYGRVVTYGQVAAICGYANAAWEVGQIAHFGPSELPWHRLVNKPGGMAKAFVPGGPDGQKQLLEAEGVQIDDDYRIVNLTSIQWQPNLKN